MYNSNIYVDINKEDVAIKQAIAEMKATGSVLFLSILTEEEIRSYVYRELSLITKGNVIELLANINRMLVA